MELASTSSCCGSVLFRDAAAWILENAMITLWSKAKRKRGSEKKGKRERREREINPKHTKNFLL